MTNRNIKPSALATLIDEVVAKITIARRVSSAEAERAIVHLLDLAGSASLAMNLDDHTIESLSGNFKFTLTVEAIKPKLKFDNKEHGVVTLDAPAADTPNDYKLNEPKPEPMSKEEKLLQMFHVVHPEFGDGGSCSVRVIEYNEWDEEESGTFIDVLKGGQRAWGYTQAELLFEYLTKDLVRTS